MIDPIEIGSDGRASGSAVDDLVAAFHCVLEGRRIAYVAGHDLDGPREHVHDLGVELPHQGLDSVSPEHELADHNATDAAGGSNDEDGGVLRARDGELAHGSALPEAKKVEGLLVVRTDSPGDLPEAGELPPHLVEDLPRPPPETHRVDVLEAYHRTPRPGRLLLLDDFIIAASLGGSPRDKPAVGAADSVGRGKAVAGDHRTALGLGEGENAKELRLVAEGGTAAGGSHGSEAVGGAAVVR